MDSLKIFGIRGSMSRKSNPYDNAVAESFFRALKCEWVNHYYRPNAAESRRILSRRVSVVMPRISSNESRDPRNLRGYSAVSPLGVSLDYL